MTNIPDSREERGLVILSCLLNFIDWLDINEQTSIPFTKERRGELVLEFLTTHSKGTNYYLQAEDIAARLGVPFGKSNDAICGEFRFDRENGLSFTCHSPNEDFELTELTLSALREHVEQQIRNKSQCPFNPDK